MLTSASRCCLRPLPLTRKRSTCLRTPKEGLSMSLRTHKIQLDPNNKQATLMAQHCGYARVAYNAALSSFKSGLDDGNWKTLYDIKKEFNARKRDIFPWCDEMSQNASKNAIHHFSDAVRRWKSGQNSFPKPKNRSGKHSYQADNGMNSVRVERKRVKLPVIGWVRMTEELRWTGDIGRVVVSRKDDKWFVSILVHTDEGNSMVQMPLIDDHLPVGVDVGINTLATLSDGTKYENRRPLKVYLRKLRRAGRTLSRKTRFSNNWHKSRKRLASIHYRISCIREDSHHKASTAIVRKASAIGIETLNVSGLLKNRKLAKALSDSALSKFLTMIKYKAERRGIPITEASMFFASSQTCSSCGHKKAELNLSERTYHCTECNFTCDRDVNAAINLCPV